MRLLVAVSIAIRAILRNKERSLLTTLGIVIGVAAVIVTVAIGAGARASVQAQIANLGSNMVIVIPGSTSMQGANAGLGGASTLTLDDALAITRVAHVTAVSPAVNIRTQAISATNNWQTSVTGVSPAFLFIRGWDLQSGTFFGDTDVAASAKVAVIGATVAANLFPEQDPIGQTITIRGVPFRVIGVLQTRGHNAFGMDQDDVIFVPYTAAMQRLQASSAGANVIGILFFSVDASQDMSTVIADVTSLLRERHRLGPGVANDFSVRNTQDLANVYASTALTLQILLAGVATVSLIVGGIGIMNIMLVSVTERTKEIGLRMAVGAPSTAILLQFLVESAVLASVGGAIGVILGTIFALLASVVGHFPFIPSPAAVVASLVFSAIVGIFFGYSPARRAARLDPIVALRAE
ncbi:MAG TPA: ABC transporter permease [Candidatus Aquilonibacter sp.]|nr:ABC transporter permease [Candidatus Aquilonibacter sp.]